MNRLVSIIIPAFKHRWFEEALESAIAQDYRPLEIIVTDDSQGAEIRNICDAIGIPSTISLKYYSNNDQLGEAANFLHAVELSSGEFIKPLYDDDKLITNNYLTKAVEAFEQHSDICLVSCSRIVIDSLGKRINPKFIAHVNPFAEDVRIEAASLLSCLTFMHVNFIGEPSCTMFRKTDLNNICHNPFRMGNNVTPGIGDLTLYANLLMETGRDLIILKESMVAFRDSSDSSSAHIHARLQKNPSAHELTRMNFANGIISKGFFSGRRSVLINTLSEPKKSYFFDLIGFWKQESPRKIINFHISDLANTEDDNTSIENPCRSTHEPWIAHTEVDERNTQTQNHVLYDLRSSLGVKNINYLEIGSYPGHSASAILSHPFPTQVYCIDPLNLPISRDSESVSQAEALYKNLNTHKKPFNVIQAKSTDPFVRDYLNNLGVLYGMIFIAGDHRYSTVISDFQLCYPLLANGGYMIFDNYFDLSGAPDVCPAVNEILRFIERETLPLRVLGTPLTKRTTTENIHDACETSESQGVVVLQKLP